MTCCAFSTSEAQKASTAFSTMPAASSLILTMSSEIFLDAFSGISSERKTASRVMESMWDRSLTMRNAPETKRRSTPMSGCWSSMMSRQVFSMAERRRSSALRPPMTPSAAPRSPFAARPAARTSATVFSPKRLMKPSTSSSCSVNLVRVAIS